MLSRCIRILCFFTIIELNISKLFVSDTKYSYFSYFRKQSTDSFHVYFSVFHTGAMTYVDGKLEHCESIFYEGFPKVNVGFLLFLGFCW